MRHSHGSVNTARGDHCRRLDSHHRYQTVPARNAYMSIEQGLQLHPDFPRDPRHCDACQKKICHQRRSSNITPNRYNDEPSGIGIYIGTEISPLAYSLTALAPTIHNIMEKWHARVSFCMGPAVGLDPD